MPESHAEQLDPSVLGEEVGDDRPAEDFPPERPLGVDDPSIVEGGMIARDDVATREARRTAGDGPDESGVDESGVGLIDPAEGGRDDEEQLVADEASSADGGPEAGAVRIDP